MKKNIIISFIALLAGISISYGQSDVEAKRLLQKRATEVDSTIHHFIVENDWELIYRSEKRGLKTIVTPFERHKVLSFEGNSYDFRYVDSSQSGQTDEYFFFDMYLILKVGKEEAYYYNILNIIDGRYLTVQVSHIVGKRNESLVSTNRRLLFRKVERRL